MEDDEGAEEAVICQIYFEKYEGNESKIPVSMILRGI
jgi:hypothetical protein